MLIQLLIDDITHQMPSLRAADLFQRSDIDFFQRSDIDFFYLLLYNKNRRVSGGYLSATVHCIHFCKFRSKV